MGSRFLTTSKKHEAKVNLGINLVVINDLMNNIIVVSPNLNDFGTPEKNVMESIEIFSTRFT